MEPIFKFKMQPGNPKSPEGMITPEEITRMASQEFLLFKSRLVNVRHTTRWDVSIYEPVIIKEGTYKDLFRKGVGQEETFATSDGEYKKKEFHTNMQRGGEFPLNSLTVISDISVVKAFTPGVPTTVVNGIVTNPRATFPTYLDSGLTLDTWLNQNILEYREGENIIKRDLFRKFPQNDGQTGVLGASQGGIMQNAFMQRVGLDNPRILEGGEDFSLRLLSLGDFDASATGINQTIVQRIELECTELIRVPN